MKFSDSFMCEAHFIAAGDFMRRQAHFIEKAHCLRNALFHMVPVTGLDYIMVATSF